MVHGPTNTTKAMKIDPCRKFVVTVNISSTRYRWLMAQPIIWGLTSTALAIDEKLVGAIVEMMSSLCIGALVGGSRWCSQGFAQCDALEARVLCLGV